MRKFISLTVFIALLILVSKSYSQSTKKPTTKSTDQSSTESTVKDIDGNEYKTVKIGNQIWFAQNLRTKKLNNGKAIPKVEIGKAWQKNKSTMAYNYPNVKSENIEISGLLYNWYAVETQKLCPTGWHVPTSADWDILRKYLIDNGYNYDGSTSGNKIAVSMSETSEWKENKTIYKGTPGSSKQNVYSNKSGFSALPVGPIYTLEESGELGKSGQCIAAPYGDLTMWWTTNEKMGMYGITNSIFTNFKYLQQHVALKYYGLSVRCVKD